MQGQGSMPQYIIILLFFYRYQQHMQTNKEETKYS